MTTLNLIAGLLLGFLFFGVALGLLHVFVMMLNHFDDDHRNHLDDYDEN